MKNKKTKKGAMGPWPSIIGGVIVCAIILYVLVFIASGGLKQSRILINKLAYNSYINLMAEGWTDGSSITPDWYMVGVNKKEIWGIITFDYDTARKFNDMPLCTSGQTTGKCITSSSKAVLEKCIVRSDDICVCLANFNLKYGNMNHAVVVDWNIDHPTVLQNIRDWNDEKVIPKINNPVEFFDCKKIITETNCVSFAGTPCLMRLNVSNTYKALVWIGVNSKEPFKFEVLTVRKPAEFDANYLELNGTVISGPNILNNPPTNANPFW